MKKAILLSLIFLLPGLSAQARTPKQSLDSKILRKAERLQRALHNNIDYMSRAEKQQVHQLIKEAIQVTHGNVGGGGYGALVKFSVGSNSYILEVGGSLESILAACEAKIVSSSSQWVSSLQVTVEGQSDRQSVNAWLGPKGQCQAAMGMAVNLAFEAGRPLTHKRYVVVGKAGAKTLLAEGDSLYQLEESCSQLNSGFGNGSSQWVSSVTARLNGGLKATRTVNAWVRKQQACNSVLSLAL